MGKTFELGKIVNTHGVRGELKLDPWCDGEEIFPLIKCAFIGAQRYEILSFRMHKNAVLLTLEGVDTMEKAIALKNSVLTIPRDSFTLPDDKYLYSDMFGFEVFDQRTQKIIGELVDVIEMPASDMYVIKGEKGEFLIPAVEEFEVEADFEKERLVLNTIEGLLPNED